MRYLLAYYSRAASQWRCLDTGLLPQQIDRPEDIPAALESAPIIALSWMLERRAFAGYQAALGAEDGGASVIVYDLDPKAGSPFGEGSGYVGPWLEMFMQTHKSAGLITLAAERPITGRESFAALRERSTDPLQASDPACQKTMDRMREYLPTTDDHVDATSETRKQEAV